MDGLSEQGPKTGELFRTRPRVLIIEHDRKARRHTEYEVRSSGLSNNISTVSSLREANDTLLVRFPAEPPDVIICAYRFPGEEEDGISFARRVQDRGFRTPPTFIIRTNNVGEVEDALKKADQLTKNSVQDVLAKDTPFTKEYVEGLARQELTRAVRSLR